MPPQGQTQGLSYKDQDLNFVLKDSLRTRTRTTTLASTQEKAKKIFKDLILESAQYNMQINVKTRKLCYSKDDRAMRAI